MRTLPDRALAPVANEHGIALVTVLLIALAVTSLAVAATTVGMNGTLIRKHSAITAMLDDAAIAGLEEARSSLNGNASVYPAGGGYATLESNVPVVNALGDTIWGLRRSTYVGPSGIISGQYGVFGSIISEVTDGRGNRRIRRMVVNQESFAKFAYFTDIEPSTIRFGNTDQIFGPVHSNSNIRMYAPSGGNQATFHANVTTAGVVQNPSYGNFVVGYDEGVAPIAMPGTPALTLLRTQAQAAGLYFVSSTAGNYGEAEMRVEFVAVDFDGDPLTIDDIEGYVRVYQNPGQERYVVGWAEYGNNRVYSAGENCGEWLGGVFTSFNSMATTAQKNAAFNSGSAACFLGGDERLNSGVFDPNEGGGNWIAYGGAPAPGLCAIRPDCGYLHPLTRNVNINSKGVVFIDGKVAASGVVRGLTTLAASDDIIIVDDITQDTDPAANLCDRDILGLFSQHDVILAHNTRNSPWRRPGSSPYRTMGSTNHETIHAVVLALNIFTVQNYSTRPDAGSNGRQNCELVNWGRGCLYLTGGIIQTTRGAVGLTSGAGNLKRYDYNTCAATTPPPYFPTTGVFIRNHVYDIDPAGFDVLAWYATHQN